MIVVCDLTNYVHKGLPIGGFCMLGDCGQNMDHDYVGTVV